MGLIVALTPNDSTVVEGVTMLTCTGSGNIVVRGTQTGAADVTWAATAGQQFYVPNGFILRAATTATVAGMG